ncbi:hypothetical protein V8G54_021279 [Vigna mungo]|uniref:ELMO domain-containing protein n=1 Tax=Vigna mungo TaxID=3915 RepID=A0AAQ3NFU5_VIGMU
MGLSRRSSIREMRYCLFIHTGNKLVGGSMIKTVQVASIMIKAKPTLRCGYIWLLGFDQQRGLAERRESDARPSFDLTSAQEECLLRLQSRIDIPYDSSIPEHQDALRALWRVAFPEEELRGLISEQWKDMGWQGKDPSTDFRGGGFISLENLLFFARNFPKSFQDLLRKQEGDRSVWEYPFAVAGVNITFMLIQMLDLEAGCFTLLLL